MAAVWLVAFGVLGARHEADVAHVVNARTGLLCHAQAIAGRHLVGSPSDVHGVVHHDADLDACAIETALHQAARLSASSLTFAAVATHAAEVAVPPLRIASVADHLYRLAPKTSPPLA